MESIIQYLYRLVHRHQWQRVRTPRRWQCFGGPVDPSKEPEYRYCPVCETTELAIKTKEGIVWQNIR